MIDHLSQLDLVRVLAFDDDDADARLLADHAATCEQCGARLAAEARLDLAGIAAAESRRAGDGAAPPRRKRALVFAVGASALAAGVLVVAASATRHEPIIAAAADLPVTSAPGPAGSVLPAAAPDTNAWMVGGSAADRYRMITEQDPTRTPPLVRGLLRTDGPGALGYGTVFEAFAATRSAGHRVRFSADVATTDVDGHVALWMRADEGERPVLLDNMAARPIRGSSAWTRYAIVADVPASVTRLVVGLMLDGSGRAVLADARVEVVGNDVPVTMDVGSSPVGLAPYFAP